MPRPGRGVALRIEIDDQDILADGGERGAEIDGGRRLADAALLVGDGEDAGRPDLLRGERAVRCGECNRRSDRVCHSSRLIQRFQLQVVSARRRKFRSASGLDPWFNSWLDAFDDNDPRPRIGAAFCQGRLMFQHLAASVNSVVHILSLGKQSSDASFQQRISLGQQFRQRR